MFLKFLPHASWIASLGVHSDFQGSVTVCWGCTLAFQGDKHPANWTQGLQ